MLFQNPIWSSTINFIRFISPAGESQVTHNLRWTWCHVPAAIIISTNTSPVYSHINTSLSFQAVSVLHSVQQILVGKYDGNGVRTTRVHSVAIVVPEAKSEFDATYKMPPMYMLRSNAKNLNDVGWIYNWCSGKVWSEIAHMRSGCAVIGFHD